ncbi:Glycosyltransferase involved in cell wall bisynthesis [Formosa sp. Hel1_31_208]|uniref:glycosyltransferase family 2 protein n=1 Tax=Formosa sp. Hel1_31_208 TaxID=1798225 RepID=UPI00087A089B|nr:glycosyltransferase family A protein [Formosa sp. Hel1_31_208]SDS69027.1 Glycosyltransferase involved in cell wall bisynthesis [Formosa sp. Hel1_31_208]
MKPLISIIIPVYNRSNLIGETLDSILVQTYPNWECIIVDDESTDDTCTVVHEYIQKDARFKLFSKPNKLPKGPSAARNYGYLKSQGDYINWFDSDDLMLANKLEIDIEHLKSGDFDFTISQSSFFVTAGVPKKVFWNPEIWSEDPVNDFIRKQIGWGVNSPLWKRESLERVQLTFDETLLTADDFKYHVQALQNGLQPIIIDKTLVNIREHSERLNEHSNKSPYKLLVYTYLIKNRKALALNPKSIQYLNWHFLRYYSGIVKSKNFRLSFIMLLKCLGHAFKLKTKKKVFQLFCAGLIYYIFGIGYKLLDY